MDRIFRWYYVGFGWEWLGRKLRRMYQFNIK